MTIRTLIIVMVLAGAPARAQDAPPRCAVKAEPSRRVELPDGRIVSIDVQSLARHRDTLMVVGRYAYVFAALSTPQSLPLMRDSIIGALMEPDGKTSLVPSPLRSTRVLFPKVADGEDGFHAVFATAPPVPPRLSLPRPPTPPVPPARRVTSRPPPPL